MCNARDITELICHRQAAKQKENLPDNFWNIPRWKKIYQKQIIRANTLLRIYEPDVLMATLEKYKWIYSLFFPKLPDFCDEVEYEIKLQKAKKSKSKNVIIELSDKSTRKPYGSKSLKSKLDE